MEELWGEFLKHVTVEKFCQNNQAKENTNPDPLTLAKGKKQPNKQNYSKHKTDSENLIFHDQEASFQNYVASLEDIIYRIITFKRGFGDTGK